MLKEKAFRRREEISRASRRSPLPPENIRPDWMTGGIEETFDYWNRLAEVWDDLSMGGSGGGDGVMFSHIPETDEALTVLDIGCGTGASWEYILQRAPNAHITGIDLCPAMLDKIRERFQDNLSRFTLIEGSTVDVPFGEACFDFVTSELHIHFFSIEVKAQIYKKIYLALRPSGTYIAHDLCQTQKHEQNNRQFYREFVSTLEGADKGSWNYKQTISVATQQRLFAEAGFTDIEPWIVQLESSGIGTAVYVARKS